MIYLDATLTERFEIYFLIFDFACTNDTKIINFIINMYCKNDKRDNNDSNDVPTWQIVYLSSWKMFEIEYP